ncbi:MAG TPA: TetR/AcrR family transcriptional regulator [Ktedonobacterales bacterium]|nr:TetR/AcrR family transcriptional regulator [Ktedonobacterales bacterium]
MGTSSKIVHRTSGDNGPPRRRATRRATASHEQRGQASNADPRDQRDERQQREERILDAAAALMVRWGFRKTTIDDVAREAGVGKGTIYLHWKDKNELFTATIWRAGEQATQETQRRIAADPEGGRFHRLWTHGMLAILANPLLAALMTGNSDIFQGLLETLSPELVEQLIGNVETHIIQLQQAGLIRADLSVPAVTFLMSALKMGLITASDLMGKEHALAPEELTEALSDLMRRWLEPEQLPTDNTEGKRLMNEWMDSINDFTQQRQ